MSAVADYRKEPFRAYCRSCSVVEWVEDRPAALDFAADHRPCQVRLSPIANLLGVPR